MEVPMYGKIFRWKKIFVGPVSVTKFLRGGENYVRQNFVG